jgi:hypothetical protein
MDRVSLGIILRVLLLPTPILIPPTSPYSLINITSAVHTPVTEGVVKKQARERKVTGLDSSNTEFVTNNTRI